jgi:two-component system, LuxR family, response regulator FixJ
MEGEVVPQIPPVIAIVEDDTLLGRALARLLHAVGWHTVIFASAEAFLRTGLQSPPQCLVLDVRLPGMSGIELAEHFVIMGLALPVIIITGRDDIQLRLRAMRVGVVAYLQKPVDEQDLRRAIEHALGREASER